MTKTEQLDWITSRAIKLVQKLPLGLIDHLVKSLRTVEIENWVVSRIQIIESISNPHYRMLAAKFLDKWRAEAPEISANELSIALFTVATADKFHREQQSLEFVWTGPAVGVFPVRETQQALIQLIDSANQRLLIVSYAVFNIPNVADALIRASGRNVQVSIIIETPHLNEGGSSYDTLKALGPYVAANSQIFLWPLSKRKMDAKGKHGILHVKCAVADGQRLFLSSANLTEYAFTINMELGLLINGGELPGKVERQFDQMIQSKILQPLPVHEVS